MTATIGFNHLFIEHGSLTGPGYYAVQLVENLIRLPSCETAPIRFRIFAQKGTEHHYSPAARDLIVGVPTMKGRFSRVIWEQAMFPWQVRKEKIDLLFSPAFVSPLFGAPIMAVSIPDMYYRVAPRFVEKFQRKYWRVMIPVSSKVCDLVLTISKSSGNDIERYLPSARGKVVVTPLASRFTEARLEGSLAEPQGDRPYILMIANLTPNKNVTQVIKALSLLRDEGRAIDFVHIGRDQLGELSEAVALFDVADRVRSLGKVDDETLVGVARESLCVVVASLYEGFGMPAIEAQAIGAPLICSDRGALPEVAGDAALTFDPEDPEAIAACIAHLMDDPDLCNTMRHKGFENVRNFSWERTAELTMRAFEQHLSKLPAR